ncbi:MAG: hypothetical protein OHK0039_13790 [Bacteroidia bacterium]
MRITHLWLLLLPLLASCGISVRELAYPAAYDEDELHVFVEPLEEKYDLDAPIRVRFGVHNPGSSTVRISRWQSPLEGGFSTDYFRIYHKRDRVFYTGERLHRNSWLLRETLVLKPGETLTCEVDITQAYQIDAPGKYSLRFEGSPLNRLPDSPEIEIRVK